MACLGFGPLSAQTDNQKSFGDYHVLYSVFNSSFITPEIAAIYGITRAPNQALINISLIRSSGGQDSLGLKAKVSGQVQNLMLQSTPLVFREIDEGDAIYYIAALRFDDQDPLNFSISVQNPASSQPYEIKFARTLYVD